MPNSVYHRTHDTLAHFVSGRVATRVLEQGLDRAGTTADTVSVDAMRDVLMSSVIDDLDDLLPRSGMERTFRALLDDLERMQHPAPSTATPPPDPAGLEQRDILATEPGLGAPAGALAVRHDAAPPVGSESVSDVATADADVHAATMHADRDSDERPNAAPPEGSIARADGSGIDAAVEAIVDATAAAAEDVSDDAPSGSTEDGAVAETAERTPDAIPRARADAATASMLERDPETDLATEAVAEAPTEDPTESLEEPASDTALDRDVHASHEASEVTSEPSSVPEASPSDDPSEARAAVSAEPPSISVDLASALVRFAEIENVTFVGTARDDGHLVDARGDGVDAVALARRSASCLRLMQRRGHVTTFTLQTGDAILVLAPFGDDLVIVVGTPQLNLGAVFAARSALEEES